MATEKDENRSPQDWAFRELVATPKPTMDYTFRKNTGLNSELMFISAQALVLVHDALSIAALLDVAVKGLRNAAKKPALDELRRKARQSVAATDLLEGGLHPLHAMVIVNVCAALESGIEDTLLVALRFTPGITRALEAVDLKNLPDASNRDLTFEESRDVLSKLEDWASKQRPKAERRAPNLWLDTLKAVGLDVALEDEDRRNVREMIYVRNCICIEHLERMSMPPARWLAGNQTPSLGFHSLRCRDMPPLLLH
jgi:hypothetical protein